MLYTKKLIIIGVTLAVSAAALITGIMLQTRSVSMAAADKSGLAASHAVPESDLMKTVTDERDFGAATPDEAHKPKTAEKSDDTQPTYTKSTIPKVTGLSRLSEKADSIVIGWDDIEGIQGYRVYRRDDNASGADYSLFSTVRKAGLTIRNLTRGSKYSFRVVPFITDKNSSIEGEATEVTFGTSPTDVEGFHLSDETKDTITVSWDKNDRADGYLVERCWSNQWSEFGVYDADTTEFTDDDLEDGRAYYYRICAFRDDSTGRMEGAKTAIRTIAGLVGPEDKSSASKLGRVSLDYKEAKHADGYEIYYSKDKESWEQLTDTDRTHYSTSRLEDGETYFFRIYSYKIFQDIKIKGSYTELEFVAQKEIYDKEVGDTYVEVSLSDQHMWYIVDGDVYLESDCVTGNYGSADTPKGYFAVNNKISPCTLKGDDYVSYVTYWMPFIGGGWGLHDASWRSRFGGSIYKGDGSHGCVNLPTDIAKQMYAHIEVGTPVIVY